ncbi:hypothetical protein Ahy_B02g057852 isoform E [Arachis hypogaea]|uniref:Uncharacterized protein n=1 Tax=Arachis hypogaea TaxID=3818 RepID=A0A445AD53_ARAHY|nr:hypothetical protein Ahy_B02g057852 isoform E [Arachis hypogaea]
MVKMMKPHNKGIELSRCYDFKPSFCMQEYIASCLRDIIVIVPCPDSKYKIEYGLEHFCFLLLLECKVAWHGGIECGEFMSLNENERANEDLW